MSNMKYTPEQHERVRELFAQKRTARQIGLELGIPRYTVISMFRRLGLSQPRPAHWGYRREKTKEIQVGQTVTARISLRRSGPQSPPVIELYVRDESLNSYVNDEPISPVVTLLYAHCRWPIGDPLSPDFQFCCAPADLGRPYCGEHCRKAYMSLREWGWSNSKAINQKRTTNHMTG